MASVYFGVNRGSNWGGTDLGVAVSSSTTSSDVELVVDLTKNVERDELIRMLDRIKDKIIQSVTNPPV